MRPALPNNSGSTSTVELELCSSVTNKEWTWRARALELQELQLQKSREFCRVISE